MAAGLHLGVRARVWVCRPPRPAPPPPRSGGACAIRGVAGRRGAGVTSSGAGSGAAARSLRGGVGRREKTAEKLVQAGFKARPSAVVASCSGQGRKRRNAASCLRKHAQKGLNSLVALASQRRGQGIAALNRQMLLTQVLQPFSEFFFLKSSEKNRASVQRNAATRPACTSARQCCLWRAVASAVAGPWLPWRAVGTSPLTFGP